LAAPLPTQLSAFHFFTWDPRAGFAFNEGVIPYDLNSALFSDHALKQRAMWIPPGTTGHFRPEDAFELPVGSVLIKNFYFPADFQKPTEDLRLVETRLLLHYPDGWQGWPYIWDDEQKDAVLSPAGEVRPISFVDQYGHAQTANYLVPQHNQCVSCHQFLRPGETLPDVTLLGIKARHLDRDYDYGAGVGVRNQLAFMAERGVLADLPPLDTLTPAYDFRPIQAGGADAIPPEDVTRAARDYLDINCAHCHGPHAVQGITSQLFLNHDNTDDFRLGVCKRPGSAGAGTGGLTYDIQPGQPERSILYFRMHTTEVGAMMPLLGRSLVDVPGTELIHRWIGAMTAPGCTN
jgi:uncharacterized repeat protein (TIGR03806 family)